MMISQQLSADSADMAASMKPTFVNRDMERCFSEVLSSLTTSFSTLTDKQKSAISTVVKDKRDTFVQLPTGYGKSVCYQLLGPVWSAMVESESARGAEQMPIVIVISPLTSLMEDQVESCRRMGLTACRLGADVPGVRHGKYQLVYGSPESWLGQRQLLLTDLYQKNVIAIVADEVHCVEKWGKADRCDKTAFRAAFNRLGELRSIFPHVPVMALTATATKKTRMSIKKTLNMRDMCLLIENPNRTNIFLAVRKGHACKSIADALGWLLTEITNHKHATPRTIIYCQSISDCAKVYEYFRTSLGKIFFKDDNASFQSALVCMYHSCTLEPIKRHVMNMLDIDSEVCRVVVATTALGMGVDMRDVKTVIHYGTPKDKEAYVQGIGRCARDGRDGKSILYHKTNMGVKDDMRVYTANSVECRRKLLYTDFDNSEVEPVAPMHKCCDVCAPKCECDTCSEEDSPISSETASDDKPIKERKVTESDKKCIRNCLQEFRATFGGLDLFASVEVAIGLTDHLIEEVIEHSPFIFSMSYIIDNLPVFNISVAKEILHITQEVFGDDDIDEQFDASLDDLLPFLAMDVDFDISMFEEPIIVRIDFDEDDSFSFEDQPSSESS